jgi:tetratricopeptide (TPR) repeat protein
LTHRYQEAFGHAKELVKVSPQSPECLRILAESALRTGNYEAALDAGRKHLALKPQDESLRFFTAAALILMDRFKEAETEIALVKDRPFRISLENVLASRTRDWSKVLAGIRKQQRSPDHKDDAEIYYTLLVIAEQTRDVKLLEESWQKLEKAGLLKEPEHANSVGYVATVLNHRLEEAGNLIRLALDKEPENEAYIDSLAWYHYQKGEYAKAWECIRKALEQMEYKANPPGTIFDHAGDIALKLGKKELALEYYRQALGDYLATDLDIQAVQKKIHRLTAENN